MRSTTLPLVALLLLGACASTPPQPDAPTPAEHAGITADDISRLETLVRYMTGSFDSADQAAADRDYHNIRLHMTPIWKERRGNAGEEGTRWLYVEQAMADQPAKPYRQRIYRLSTLGGGQFKSETYEIPGSPLEFAGAWKKPELLSNVKPDDLLTHEGCAVLLTDKKDAFTGATRERDCPSTLRGASYTRSEATITSDSVISWDRGFDEAGNQVWGATKGGYIFRRRSR